MKTFLRFSAIAALATVLVVAGSTFSFADTYNLVTFTGNINPGNANVKSPFNSVLTQGGAISGSFVIDNNLIPASGSGFVNVPFSSFPDIANIPPSTAFTIDLGSPSLTFTLADAIQNSGAIQFNNGQFRGFFFVADFLFTDGNPYRFDDQGGTWSIKLLDQIGGAPVPLTSAKVSGVITGMTVGAPFVPSTPAAVPEASTLLLLGGGLVGLVACGKRLKKA